MIGFNNANVWNNSFYNQPAYNSFGYGQNNFFNSLISNLLSGLFGGFGGQTGISQNISYGNNGGFNSTNIWNNFYGAPTTPFPGIFNQTQVEIEPKEKEKVFIIGSYQNEFFGDYDYHLDQEGEAADGVEVNLGRMIKDFAGQASGNGSLWDYRVHDNDSSNNQELMNLYNNLDSAQKNLTFDKGQAYIISESGEILGTVANKQVGKNYDGKEFSSKTAVNSSFEILNDLGLYNENLRGNGGLKANKNTEEASGGRISYNGQEYEVASTVLRKNTPLILDLKGDGIELTSHKDGVNFDLNGDGKVDQTAWTNGGSDDAFLVLDKDGNGEIDSGKELFGDQNGAENGFLELSKYDSNNDGKVDANDEVYSQLQTWQDANHNGKVDDGELKSLVDSNVKSVSTGFTKEYDETGKLKEDKHGNSIGLVGGFERTDGSQGEMIDALLQYIG